MAASESRPSNADEPPRRKAWRPKVKTGCKTCKKRKLKCDEQKPACRRCTLAKIKCDGYDPPPRAWIFEGQSRPKHGNPIPSGSESPTLPLSTDDESVSSQSVESARCHECHESPSRCRCLTDRNVRDRDQKLLRQYLQPNGPYKWAQEQYYFKYFVEVAAAAVSRSGISSSFWSLAFPQMAWSFPATKDALLSSAMMFQNSRDSLIKTRDKLTLSRPGLVYESRSMRSLVDEQPPLEAVLVASSAFWMNSLISGNWDRCLQHAYHVLRLVTGVQDRSKHDLLILRYSEGWAKFCLAYHRTTRGPCPLHPPKQGAGPPDFLACEASCYMPEVYPLEVRIADGLYHLQDVPSALSEYRNILNLRAVRHSQHDRILQLLQKTLNETQFLKDSWSDFGGFGLDAETMRLAEKQIPFTRSPFPSILRDLGNYIEWDQDSKVNFIELELRTRVLIPNFGVSVGRDDPRVIADFMLGILV